MERVPDRGRSTLSWDVFWPGNSRVFVGGFPARYFGPVPRYFPRNLQKPETRPIFAMAKMSPRGVALLVVGVVRWAPNLHTCSIQLIKIYLFTEKGARSEKGAAQWPARAKMDLQEGLQSSPKVVSDFVQNSFASQPYRASVQ